MVLKASERLALQWAEERMPFFKAERLTNSPWGRVHRLYHDGSETFLKSTCAERPREVALTSALAELGMGLTPRVLAKDEELGLLHLEAVVTSTPNDQNSIDRESLLSSYSNLQVAATNSSIVRACCDSLDVTSLHEEMLSFLDNKSLFERIFFIDLDSAEAYRTEFIKRKGYVLEALHSCRELKFLVEHGDLHRGNFLHTSERQVIFVDWSDALLAPAGFSIAGVYGSTALAFEAIASCSSFRSYVGRVLGADYDNSNLTLSVSGSMQDVGLEVRFQRTCETLSERARSAPISWLGAVYLALTNPAGTSPLAYWCGTWRSIQTKKAVFAFHNRERHRVKLLVYDRAGFWLLWNAWMPTVSCSPAVRKALEFFQALQQVEALAKQTLPEGETHYRPRSQRGLYLYRKKTI